MMSKFGALIKGSRLLIRDAMARAERERLMADPRSRVSPIMRSSKGPAIGLDGQAFLLGISDWSTEWPIPRKRQALAAGIARLRRQAA